MRSWFLFLIYKSSTGGKINRSQSRVQQSSCSALTRQNIGGGGGGDRPWALIMNTPGSA